MQCRDGLEQAASGIRQAEEPTKLALHIVRCGDAISR